MRLTIPIELPPVSLGVGKGGNSDAASGKISIISKCFHRSKPELKVLVEILKMQKNLKTIGAFTESTYLIFKAFNLKIINLVILSL